MRRHLAILRTTAREVCSEPLTFLLTLTALGCAAVLPSLHFHQFGDPSRMARDAGLSALLIVGLCQSVFCTIRTYRREIESGTLQMALAASVSRTGFFLAKLAGAFLAYLVFAVTVTCVSLTAVNGAELGGALAAQTQQRKESRSAPPRMQRQTLLTMFSMRKIIPHFPHGVLRT